MSDLHSETLTASAALEALAELEHNTPDQVKQLRSHERITIRAKVTAQPGNTSRRHEISIQGVSGDISQGGCLILFPTSLPVGDIYWLTFEEDTVPIDPLFARCVRCRLVSEDAFEVGFRFFESIDLSKFVAPAPSSSAISIFD